MGAAPLGRLTRAPPVPGERFLGSFSRARGEFSASGLPLLLRVGSFSRLAILDDPQLSSRQPQLTAPGGFLGPSRGRGRCACSPRPRGQGSGGLAARPRPGCRAQLLPASPSAAGVSSGGGAPRPTNALTLDSAFPHMLLFPC